MFNLKTKKMKDLGEQKILNDIDSYGWSIMNVFDPERKFPSFTYSIGIFHSLKSPEIIVYGMDNDDAGKLINTIGDLVKKGVVIEPGKVYKEFMEDSWPCMFIKVEKENYNNHFGFCHWFYKSWDFPVLQCVWSDEKGHFPWEENFNPKIKHLQVVLGKSF